MDDCEIILGRWLKECPSWWIKFVKHHQSVVNWDNIETDSYLNEQLKKFNAKFFNNTPETLSKVVFTKPEHKTWFILFWS